jgi:hypothetical protein
MDSFYNLNLSLAENGLSMDHATMLGIPYSLATEASCPIKLNPKRNRALLLCVFNLFLITTARPSPCQHRTPACMILTGATTGLSIKRDSTESRQTNINSLVIVVIAVMVAMEWTRLGKDSIGTFPS